MNRKRNLTFSIIISLALSCIFGNVMTVSTVRVENNASEVEDNKGCILDMEKGM